MHGYAFEVHCNAPWGWQNQVTVTKSYGVDPVSDSFVFDNTSDNADYLYPDLVITMNTTGGTVTITNNSDSARIFQFTSLTANEVITVKNDIQSISSSLSLLRMSNFNKNWLRFIQGKNNIDVAGNFSSLVFTYDPARKLI